MPDRRNPDSWDFDAFATETATILAPLLERFFDNYRRVLHLVKVYQEQYGKGSGRRAVHKADLLRAGVVFMHAALEDLLRGFARLYLPASDEQALDAIPLAGQGSKHRPEKFLLGVLAQHRGKSVDQLIDESVERYLEQKSFSDTTEISSLLEAMGIAVDDEVARYFPAIEELTKRRHQIVHESDYAATAGPGRQRAASISVRKAMTWLRACRGFATFVVASIIRREQARHLGLPHAEMAALEGRLELRQQSAKRQEERLQAQKPDSKTGVRRRQ
jgi:hypothetical protein